jgi:hypothetical protein
MERDRERKDAPPMPQLARRDWVPAACEDLVQSIAAATAAADAGALEGELVRLVEANRAIHERDCINLNPAGNAMNPRAEAMLAAGLGRIFHEGRGNCASGCARQVAREGRSRMPRGIREHLSAR